MLGLLIWKEARSERRERATTVRERSILHMRFQCAEILRTGRTPDGILHRRVRSAAKQLRKLGVTRVVLPQEFPCRKELERCGLQPVSTLSLRRALAADWVEWQLGKRGITAAGARVAISAMHLTGEVVRTVTELALRHRYILLDLPYGGEELCRQLRREYGITLLMDPSVEQLQEAEALVLFDPRTDLKRTGALRLYEEEEPLPPLIVPMGLEERFPESVDRGQLISVLWEHGVIRPGQIVVGGTNLAKKVDFLADSPP